jgi:hypothetical protein
MMLNGPGSTCMTGMCTPPMGDAGCMFPPCPP